MAGREQYKADDFIKAIPGTGGIISTIASRVGCEWHTAKKYIDDKPTIQQAYQDECEKVDDLAVSTVIKAIRDGDVGVAKWWLERKRKGEFAQRQEVTGAEGEQLKVLFEYVNSPYPTTPVSSGAGGNPQTTEEV